MQAIVMAVVWLGRLVFGLNTNVLITLGVLLVLFWDKILGVLDTLVAWIVAPVLVFIFARVLDILFFLIDTLLTLLPLAPSNPFSDLAGLVETMGWLNRYVPVSEVMYLMAFVSTVYTGIVVVKAIKFVRGGG